MPTGYTACVQDGKVTDFAEFARLCARAFGANVLMRDEPFDAPIREYEPSTLYKESLDEAQAKLYDLEHTTLDEAAQHQAKENTRVAGLLKDAMEQTRINRERYTAMLAKARAWTPPTSDHVGLKDFMIEQLQESLRFDCGDMSNYYKQDTRAPQDYLREKIAKAKEKIADYAKEWEAEQERTRRRNEWNRQLVESLKAT